MKIFEADPVLERKIHGLIDELTIGVIAFTDGIIAE
jgi:hypothetical protein